MKATVLLRDVPTLLVVIALTACGGGGDGGTTVPLPASGAPPTPLAGPPLTFKVVGTSGGALAGVTVLRRETLEEATTDATGQASLRIQSAAGAVWQEYRDDLVAQLQRTFPRNRMATSTQSIVMIPREAAVVRTAGAGGTVGGKHGLTLTLPSNALMVAGGGSVDINLTPIDIAGGDIAAAPNTTFRFTPWDYNDDAILSYGMAELVVRQSGTATVANLIQPAVLEIPLYATQHPDGRVIAAGERIAVATLDRTSLLYFDSQWQPIAEGEVVTSSGSPTGLALRATLPPSDGAGGPLPLNSHFAAMALTGSRLISVNLVPPAGETLPNQSPYRVWGNVSSRGAPQGAFDYGDALPSEIGASGYLRNLYLPGGVAFDVRAEVTVGTTTYFGTTQIAATTAHMSSVQLALTRVVQLLPFITYPNGVGSVRVGTTVPVKVEFAGPQPNRVQLYADQTLIGEVSGQRAFYTFLWNTTGLTPSTRRLSAVAHDATSSSRSSDVQVMLVN